MSDFTVRSDSVDVEQIMRQIRTRIREKRGVDYTEAEVQQLASVKLEKFLDPKGVRSDLIEEYRKLRADGGDQAVSNLEGGFYASHRPALARLRRLLNPVLKLFFNPTAVAQNLQQAREREALTFEIIHNLVVETTRLGIEVHNLKIKVDSLTSRLDFDERRARALEGVVQYKRRQEPRSAGGQEPRSAGGQEQRSTGGQGPGSAGGQEPRSAGGQEPRSAGGQEPRSAGGQEPRSAGGQEPRSAGGQEPRSAGGQEPRGPGEQRGPGEGRRRRRRRRRRRPGQTMGDRGMAGGAPAQGPPDAAPASGGGAADAGGASDAGDADGGDWDDGAGADDQ